MKTLKAILIERIKQLGYKKESLIPESRHIKTLPKQTRNEVNKLTSSIVGTQSELNAIDAIGKICKVDLSNYTYTYCKVLSYHKRDIQNFILDVVPVDEEYSLDDRNLIVREKKNVKIKGEFKVYFR